MGCTIPLSRMDAASSLRRAGSMAERGWNGLGSRLATGASLAWSTAEGTAAGSGSGSSAESPLPSAFLFMSHHFLGEVQVGLRPPGLDVVEEDRLAEARSLPQAHGPRDRGPEDLVLEVLADLAHDLLSEVRALVHHGEQHALDVQAGIERALYAPHRVHELRDPLQREVFALQRDEHGVGR